jgi:D-glycero-D-manno-heptose 1,7-bisphosphate phosphatase
MVQNPMKIPTRCDDIKKDARARPAVFLDRDGTINEQMGYINEESRFVLLEGAARAIRDLNRNGYFVVVVSNQSGVARGYFPLELVYRVHHRMQELLAAEGAFLDAVFFCPHHVMGVVPGFNQSCNCRKPRTGLFERACRQMSIDLSASYVVGDRCLDIEFAERCGLPGILVETGYGLGERQWVLPSSPVKPVFVAPDLPAAVSWILGKQRLNEL